MIVIDPGIAEEMAAASKLSRAILSRFLSRAQLAAKLRGEVTVLLTDDASLKALNRTFRGKNKPTDVLSFPAIEDATGVAGDIAISMQTAARQAAEHGHALGVEVRILLLHGLLHLAGYDHETDTGEMAAREAKLRAELELPVGLIERAGPAVAKAKPVPKPKRTTSNSAPQAKPSKRTR